jgi:hypothetical protein
VSVLLKLAFAAFWLSGVTCLIVWARRRLKRGLAEGYFDHGYGKVDRVANPIGFRTQIGFYYLYIGVGVLLFLAGLIGTIIGLLQR